MCQTHLPPKVTNDRDLGHPQDRRPAAGPDSRALSPIAPGPPSRDVGGEQIPLCRLRYGGSARSFGFAIYSAARGRYEDAVLRTGLPAGTPQEALMLARNAEYLLIGGSGCDGCSALRSSRYERRESAQRSPAPASRMVTCLLQRYRVLRPVLTCGRSAIARPVAGAWILNP